MAPTDLEEENDRLRERCEAYKGQVWAGSQEIERLRSLLKPFADAAGSLDDNHRDGADIWESSAAMCIKAGDLRAAANEQPAMQYCNQCGAEIPENDYHACPGYPGENVF